MRNRSDNAVKNRWNTTVRKTEGYPADEALVTPPQSSPFVAVRSPVTFLSPVLSRNESQKKGGEVGTLEENRMELLKLIME
jgi:hypothetical protein